MTAREVAKWHGKACVVTLKQGSVLVCDDLSNSLRGNLCLILKGISFSVLLEAQNIKSIKARKK